MYTVGVFGGNQQETSKEKLHLRQHCICHGVALSYYIVRHHNKKKPSYLASRYRFLLLSDKILMLIGRTCNVAKSG